VRKKIAVQSKTGSGTHLEISRARIRRAVEWEKEQNHGPPNRPKRARFRAKYRNRRAVNIISGRFAPINKPDTDVRIGATLRRGRKTGDHAYAGPAFSFVEVMRKTL
jgi:hypothetical protein